MISSLETYLTSQLKKELPGKKAHLEAAPYRKITFNEADLHSAKKSGVLILFYEKENEIHLVLTLRQTYNGKHSGQISFPGGKYEKSDASIVQTALREADEEIGITQTDVQVIGQLSKVYIPVSQFLVYPVIGFINYSPAFTIDPHEVKEIIELKLSYLTTINSLTPTKIKLSNNTMLDVPSFIFNDKIVWGATALMLNELRHTLLDWEVTN